MKAIGRNIIIKKTEEQNKTTKGGLILTEKQREDIRFQEAKVIHIGTDVTGVKKNDRIFFDKSSSHKIEINKEIYHVIKEENVVVVL
tara:strand:- start:234 stop:494 length:261 start_codon:yes stop_codon:yes gene_type:complete